MPDKIRKMVYLQKDGEPVHNQVLLDEEYLARLKATIETRYGITPLK